MAHPRRILITAGPTHEPIDPVRYLGNRSSGQVGIALAEAAHAAGCDVRLLLGPTPLGATPEIHTERFVTTADLQTLLDEHFAWCDVLIMAAAVADYRPAKTSATKLPRDAAGLTIDLEATPDLVAGCAARKRDDQHVIAFALEQPEALERRAREKLTRKGVGAIVANPLQTMDSGTIDAVVFTGAGERFDAGPMSKPDFAAWLVRWIAHHTT